MLYLRLRVLCKPYLAITAMSPTQIPVVISEQLKLEKQIFWGKPWGKRGICQVFAVHFSARYEVRPFRWLEASDHGCERRLEGTMATPVNGTLAVGQAQTWKGNICGLIPRKIRAFQCPKSRTFPWPINLMIFQEDEPNAWICRRQTIICCFTCWS